MLTRDLFLIPQVRLLISIVLNVKLQIYFLTSYLPPCVYTPTNILSEMTSISSHDCLIGPEAHLISFDRGI